MSTVNDSAFDFEAFFENIGSFPPEDNDEDKKKQQEKEKWHLLRKKIIKVHLAVSKTNKIHSELVEKEKELSTLRNNNRELLEKLIPLEKKYDDLLPEFQKLKTAHTQTETELEALRCHSNQLQALVKELESKHEAISLEKSLLSDAQQTKNKHIKHIVMFGKLAATRSKLSVSNLKILNKYLRAVGENCYESDKETDNMEMPPSCGSIDTGIGSSLAQSDDEKIWSPEIQFAHSSSYEQAPDVNETCAVDTFQTENHISFDAPTAEKLKSSTVEDNHESNAKSVIFVNFNATGESSDANNTSYINFENKSSAEVETIKPLKTMTENNIIKNTNVLNSKTFTPKMCKPIMSNVETNSLSLPTKVNSATSSKSFEKELHDTRSPPKQKKVTKSLEVQAKVTKTYNKATTPIKVSSKSKLMKMLFEPANFEENTAISSSNKKSYCEKLFLDLEVEKIFSEMKMSSNLSLTPIPPTPVNVKKVLNKLSLQVTQSNENKKRTVKRLNVAKLSVSKRIRYLEHTNLKLNQLICKQRRQLLYTNRMFLKSKRINPLGSNEDDFMRLLSLMSKVSSRFNIEEKKTESANDSSIFKGINIYKKICSLIENNIENGKEHKSCSLKNSHNGQDKLLKINAHATSKSKDSKNHPENYECDPEDFVVQDGEISSGDSLSQSNSSINRDSALDTEVEQSSITCDKDRAENEVSCKKSKSKSKISKLEKLKQKLKRKPKIHADAPSSKKICKSLSTAHSSSLLNNTEIENKDSTMSSINLNNKKAYENAVRVMSALKAKNVPDKRAFSTPTTRVTRSGLKVKADSSSLSPSQDTNSFKVCPLLDTHKKTSIEVQVCSSPASNINSPQLAQVSNGTHKNEYQNNTRNLRSRITKSTPILSDDSTHIRNLHGSNNNNNEMEKSKMKAKQHIHLDAVDQPSDESVLQLTSRTEKMDYNDLSIFETDPDPPNPKNKEHIVSEFGHEESISGIQTNEIHENCFNSKISVSRRQLRSQFVLKPSEKQPENCLTNTAIESTNVGTGSQNCSLRYQPQPNSCSESNINGLEVIKLKNCVDENAENDNNEKQIQPNEGSQNQLFIKSMLAKYGVKMSRKLHPPAVPEHVTDSVCMEIENCLGEIIDVMPSETELNGLVARLVTRNYKFFIIALLKFLTSTKRSTDILCKAYTPPLPPMMKSEQALLYVLSALQNKWNSIDIFNEIMKNIEFTLFRLGHTPLKIHVENLSRFYAVLCRFTKSLSRLRVFMVDAMYSMNFKAIPLIKQCIDVWMHVLPLSHSRSGKNPLVLIIVYLVFYFNSNAMKANNTQDIDHLKFILTKRYSFVIHDFSEKIVIDRLRDSIVELKDKQTEGKKLLAAAIILLTKRNGVKWCQKMMVDGMLTPLLNSKTTTEAGKVFSISLLGSLLKPYPDNMKLHVEMVMNHLLQLLEQNPSFAIEQAILISLILLRKHNTSRLMQILQSWVPRGRISPELEDQIKIFIQEQPLKTWIKCLCDKSS